MKQRFLAAQDADAGGLVRFVAERVKIHAEVAHVHGEMKACAPSTNTVAPTSWARLSRF